MAEKKKEEQNVKLQHYVPKVYLKNFAQEKKGKYYINCFDKKTEKSFLVNIEKIAYEEEFYDFVKGDQKTEQALRKIETNFGKTIAKLIKCKDLEKLDEKDNENLSKFVASQMLRTKELRLELQQIPEHFLNKFGKKIAEPLKSQNEQSLEKDSIRKNHSKFILENLEIFKKEIEVLKWILIINKSPFPLWTSDNPVNKHNEIDLSPYGNLGLRSPGFELYLPLSSELTLIFCDPAAFKTEPSK